jgi:broad-specificity NMP kinase
MVTNPRLPVLWLCGAPATGKSTVAWQVFSDLADQRLCVGYLDIDQIGMLAPPPDADPSSHQFKVDSLAAMVQNYHAAGVQVLVISGVIDPEHGHDFAGAAAEADITFCHLTVDEPTLRERLAARGWPSAAADEAVTMMKGLADAPLPNDGSVGLHDAMGFEPVGTYRRIGWKHNAWHDVAGPSGRSPQARTRPPTSVDVFPNSARRRSCHEQWRRVRVPDAEGEFNRSSMADRRTCQRSVCRFALSPDCLNPWGFG